ncbi:MAG: hypothetical protein K5668_06495 [Lachnospiraceae bacterium]|nr:hypothetical protein [Lachnospiraceae bacterium]
MNTPDMEMSGIIWEMKSPQGKSKNTIKHTFQNAGHQSSNVIIDLQRCKLADEDALKDIRYHYKISKRIKRLKVIMKEKKSLTYRDIQRYYTITRCRPAANRARGRHHFFAVFVSAENDKEPSEKALSVLRVCVAGIRGTDCHLF